jgi:hypothetical protein
MFRLVMVKQSFDLGIVRPGARRPAGREAGRGGHHAHIQPPCLAATKRTNPAPMVTSS